MIGDLDVLAAVRCAPQNEPRIHPTTGTGSTQFDFTAGNPPMDGKVDHLVGKTLTLEAASRVPGHNRVLRKAAMRHVNGGPPHQRQLLDPREGPVP